MKKPLSRTPYQVTMGSYRGIGHDFLSTNIPVADRFMRVADMRGDIFIEKQSRENGQPYFDSVIWHVPIDDAQLSADARTKMQNSGTVFEEQFAKGFRHEVRAKVEIALE